jgi:signal transduction histidine kinase
MTGNGSAEAAPRYRAILGQFARGDYAIEKLLDGDPLEGVFALLAARLKKDREERERLDDIIARVNSGLFLDEILDNIYRDFKPLIPYDRIGLSFIKDEGKTVLACWARSDLAPLKLASDFSAPLAGSSLADVLQTGKPRILNDLEDYLRNKPESQSTRCIVEEGFRSSLTCPLALNGKPVGFIFFTSLRPQTYVDVHVDAFLRAATHVSAAVEKGRLASELAQSRKLLERQNEGLQNQNATKNSFLGMAAHDLRGPIGFAKMAAERLLAGEAAMSPEGRQSLLRDIINESAQMLALLNDLLEISHFESGSFQLHPVRVVMADLLQETVARHARLAEPKRTRVEMEPIPPGTVRADPVRLRQVMDNLISNAIKYSPGGSLVRVRATRVYDSWRVEVQDQGPGFTPMDQQLLFREFARLSATPTGSEKGTGLGLAITRRMVEAHGGAIGVRSEPGHGATLLFTLPAGEA